MAVNKTGLMNPTGKPSEMMDALRTAFGPYTGSTATLEERLQALPENKLNLVIQTARMVKTAQSFILNPAKRESYQMLVDRMYPKLDFMLRHLIAEVLQDADPLPEIEDTRQKQRDAAVQSVVDDYDAFLSKQKKPEITDEDIAQYEAEIQEQYPDSFLQQLAQSESSGQADAEITIKDGRTFTGLYQFGDARLSDYRKATGAKFTTQEFKEDLELQQKVADWHVKDIDQAIDSLGDEAKGYDRNGLRSVAHLGGIGGMKRFVRTKGQYDPKDELGTSLSKYYAKFSA